MIVASRGWNKPTDDANDRLSNRNGDKSYACHATALIEACKLIDVDPLAYL